ncbi:MAG: hypothetical protein ACYDCO_01870 [Armatimonadota bacterium]
MILKRSHIHRIERHGLGGDSDLQRLINSHEELRQIHAENEEALVQEREKTEELRGHLDRLHLDCHRNESEAKQLRRELKNKASDIQQLSDELFLTQIEYEAFRKHAGPLARAWAWVCRMVGR